LNYEEERIQRNCVTYFNLKYRNLVGLLCCNLNNSKDKKTGGRNKALGVVAGRSDLVFYYKQRAYHIEVKQQGKKQSKVQVAWQKTIEYQGFQYFLIYSIDDFIKLIEEIVDV